MARIKNFIILRMLFVFLIIALTSCEKDKVEQTGTLGKWKQLGYAVVKQPKIIIRNDLIKICVQYKCEEINRLILKCKKPLYEVHYKPLVIKENDSKQIAESPTRMQRRNKCH